MVIVLAYKNREADWPTTKAALLAFPYAKKPASPMSVNDPEYADWYDADDGILPNSHGELAAAGHVGDLEWDRYAEVSDALMAAEA